MYYTADVELLDFFYSDWAEDIFDMANLDIYNLMHLLGIPYTDNWT